MKVEEFLKINKTQIKDIKYTITKTKQKQDCVLIYLDNDEKINVSIDAYFKYSISSLKGLDDNLYETLKNEERVLLAYNKTLRKLSIKDYTVKQIKDYLLKNSELSELEIKDIIDRFISYGLLDDDKYCENRINYLNKQLLSYKQIKTKLIKEGINSELIEKYLVINNDGEYEKALNLANKYASTIKNKSLNATKQTIMNKLINSGFSYDNAKSALNQLKLSNDSEIILLEKEYSKAIKKYSKKYEDYDLKQRVYAYLVNKGFKSEDIKSVMEV